MNKLNKILLGIIYWTIQLTWGALTTIPGLIITAFGYIQNIYAKI